MKQVIFNNQISLECPDDFKEMSDEENHKYFSDNLLRLSLHNKEKHIILSLSKSKESFLYRLISVSKVISDAISNLRKNLKDYKHIDEYNTTIFDKPAITVCFSYTANDENIKQYGELSVFKIKNAFYALHFIGRLDDEEECKMLFKEVKDSFKSIASK